MSLRELGLYPHRGDLLGQVLDRRAALCAARKAGVLDFRNRMRKREDSPLEGDGFEPSVPLDIEWVSLSKECEPEEAKSEACCKSQKVRRTRP
jgi:hypothetical protein